MVKEDICINSQNKESKWKLFLIVISIYHKQCDRNNIHNLKFISVNYDKNGKEFDYGYF